MVERKRKDVLKVLALVFIVVAGERVSSEEIGFSGSGSKRLKVCPKEI